MLQRLELRKANFLTLGSRPYKVVRVEYGVQIVDRWCGRKISTTLTCESVASKRLRALSTWKHLEQTSLSHPRGFSLKAGRVALSKYLSQHPPFICGSLAMMARG